MDVTLPNGTVIQGVPDSATKDQVMQKAIAAGLATQEDFAAANTPLQPTQISRQDSREPYVDQVTRRAGEVDAGGILSNFFPEYQQRLDKLTPEGQQPTTSDVVGTAVSQAARTGGELVMGYGGALISTELREAAGDAWDKFAETEWGREGLEAIKSGYEKWMNFSEDNPEIAERLGTYIDIGTLFSPRPGLANLDRKVAKARGAANVSKQTKEQEALRDLVQPEVFKASDVVEEVGFMRNQQWVPSQYEQDVIDVLHTIPTVKPYRSVTYNFRKVQQHINDQKQKLDSYVKQQNKKIDANDVRDEMLLELDDFRQSDAFFVNTGEAKNAFNTYAELALKILQDEGHDLQGLLRARRRFDNAVHNQSGNVLDADVATARAQAARTVRGVLNDYLKRNTYGDEVHHMLDQQSKSLSALDNMANKRNKEGHNALARFGRDLADLNIAVPKTLVATGITAAYVADPLVASAILGTVGGSFIGRQIKRYGKSTVLKGYAEALNAANKAIKMAQKAQDMNMVSRLEMDRLMLIDLMDDVREYEEPDDGR